MTDKLLHGLLRVAATVVVASGLCGCDHEVEPIYTEPEEETKEPRAYISMMVNTGGGPVSRAETEGPTWGDYYIDEFGTSFENKIDPNEIQIAIFDENDASLGIIHSGNVNSKVWLYPVDAAKGIYHVIFDVTDLGVKSGKKYSSVVMVNYDRQFNVTNSDNITFTLNDLCGTTNPTPGEGYYTERGELPMFGFARWTAGALTVADPSPGLPVVAYVDLIRSVCKIEVRLPDPEDRQYPKAKYMSFDTAKPPRLAYVSGRHLNTTGHVTPRSAVWRNTEKKGTRELTFEESFFELSSPRWSSTTTEHLVLPATRENGRCYYIYLPEASGASMAPNQDPLRLNVTLKYQEEGQETPQTVTGTLFPSIPYDEENQRYPAGTNFNNWKLVRNHIYRFTITDFTSETELKYRVSTTQSKTIEVPDFD